ncbi:MAG TPA: hypothetical protein VF411_13155, partial [Bacteroidia bacterium]
MRKYLVIGFVTIVSILKAQDERCFNKGTSAFNLGVGIGSDIYYGYGNGVRPIYNVSYEYGVAKAGPGVIGVGVSASFISYSYTNWDYHPSTSYKETDTYSVLGLRAAYHPDFCNGKKYDVYGAIQLNIYGEGYSVISNNPNYNYSNAHGFRVYRILPSLLIGARYYFVPN